MIVSLFALYIAFVNPDGTVSVGLASAHATEEECIARGDAFLEYEKKMRRYMDVKTNCHGFALNVGHEA